MIAKPPPVFLRSGCLLAFCLFATVIGQTRPFEPDHSKLLMYRDEQGREQPVKSARDWARRRAEILDGMQQVMGNLPNRSHLPPLDVRVVEEVSIDDLTRRRISFALDDSNRRIPAYLFVPTKTLPSHTLAAVLALHQTTPLGKSEPAGLGKPNMAYGLELARRGYVVLCPDYPSFGDYTCDFKDPAFASGTMLGIAGHMRSIDLLQSLAEVDPQRIGVIGHSLGGHNAMFLAAFDSRVKVVASSCGWTPFADYYRGNLKGWSSARYMPRIRSVYHLDPSAVPFDFYEVVAAIAPRPFYSNSPLHDQNFDVIGVQKAAKEAGKVYELLDAPDALRIRTPDCAHDFPPNSREEAYAFIDSVLKR